MITISKSALNANMLEYFRRVQEEGEEILVTENQIPIIKVVPLKKGLTVDEAFADLRDKVEVQGNILDPETDEWEEV